MARFRKRPKIDPPVSRGKRKNVRKSKGVTRWRESTYWVPSISARKTGTWAFFFRTPFSTTFREACYMLLLLSKQIKLKTEVQHERRSFVKNIHSHFLLGNVLIDRLYYSHFSLVRTTSGKEKILYYRELLVSEKFKKKRWIPLVLPPPVISANFFFAIENYLLVRNFLYNAEFPCGFMVSAESHVYWGRKSRITFFF